MRIFLLLTALGLGACAAKDELPVRSATSSNSAKETSKTKDSNPKKGTTDTKDKDLPPDPIDGDDPDTEDGKDRDDEPVIKDPAEPDRHDTPGEISGTEAEQAIKSLKGVGLAEGADGALSAYKFYCSSAVSIGAKISCFVLVNETDKEPKAITGEQFALSQAMGLLKRKGRINQAATEKSTTSYAVYQISCKSKPAAVCGYVARDYLAP